MSIAGTLLCRAVRSNTGRKTRCLGLLLGCWLLLLPAARSLTAQPDSPSGQPVAQHKVLGAVHARLVPDQQQIGLSDTLRLTLTVEAPPGPSIVLPEVSSMLGPFTVASHRTTGPTSLGPQTQQWQREYLLTVTSAGSLTIPALTVEVHEGETRQPLQTDPLTITVTTLVPADADPASLKDIAPPVTLRRPGPPLWLWLAAVGLGILGLCLGAWWYQRQHRSRSVPLVQRPAHVLALAALEQLQRQDLIAQGHIEAFYVRLSTIIRRYVEMRFGLRAPEQTTEEFLSAVLATGGLLAAHRDLLGAFLQHCDLVKFARYRPLPGDMQEALESATTFVEQTADAQALVAVPVSGEEPI